MKRRILCMLLAVLFVVTPLVACEVETDDEKDSESETLGAIDTDTQETDAADTDTPESESETQEEGDPQIAIYKVSIFC